MPVPSQRPLVAKILALEPMTVGGIRYTDLDDLLGDMGDTLYPDEIAQALREQGVAVSVSTLYRWKAGQ